MESTWRSIKTGTKKPPFLGAVDLSYRIYSPCPGFRGVIEGTSKGEPLEGVSLWLGEPDDCLIEGETCPDTSYLYFMPYLGLADCPLVVNHAFGPFSP